MRKKDLFDCLKFELAIKLSGLEVYGWFQFNDKIYISMVGGLCFVGKRSSMTSSKQRRELFAKRQQISWRIHLSLQLSHFNLR